MLDIQAVVEMILAGRRHIPAHESMLVALSGIDGSGKGYVTSLIVDRLRQEGLNAVAINIDSWLTCRRGGSARTGPRSIFTTMPFALRRCLSA